MLEGGQGQGNRLCKHDADQTSDSVPRERPTTGWNPPWADACMAKSSLVLAHGPAPNMLARA
jgi:hypothetical protein